MIITLKGNPLSTNHVYKSHCKFGYPTVYLSKEGKLKKEEYKWEMLTAKQKILDCPLQVRLVLYFSENRTHDIDNYCKLVMDAGTGILWVDDKQIYKLIIEKKHDKENPRVELEYGE